MPVSMVSEYLNVNTGNGHGKASSNLDQAVCISHCIKTLGKNMNTTILPPAIGKIVGQTEFFSLGWTFDLREGKL